MLKKSYLHFRSSCHVQCGVMSLLQRSFWNAHRFLQETLPSRGGEAWYCALSFSLTDSPTKCTPLQSFWNCLMFSCCHSLNQAPSTTLCPKYDSNRRVGSSAFAFLFPPRHAEAETCDDCVTFREDLGAL